jgi:hypothetical protein
MKNTLILLISFLTVAVSSCYNEPEGFPNSPIIREVTEVKTEFRNDNITVEGERNVVTISLEFQDGDGDLGLSEQDRDSTSKFGPIVIVDGVRKSNKFYNNYFLNVYKIIDGKPVELIFPDGVTYNGFFPRLNGEGGTAIEGTLNRSFVIPLLPPVAVGDTLEFDVQIADRSLQLSNIVSTSDKRIVLKGN